MGTYTYEQVTNVDALQDVITESSIGALVTGIVSAGATTIVSSDPDLDGAQEATLDAILAAHNPAVPSIAQRIEAAREFASLLIDKWQRRIMLDGVIQAGQAHAVATALATSTIHANYGNLYALEVELGLITPIPTFLDAARLTTIRNEIRTFLGMSLL